MSDAENALPFDRKACLACVSKSPEAVAAKDKNSWLALFTADAVIEDPVGSRPQADAESRAAFWEAFIAPNIIEFDVQHDTVAYPDVWRDLTIHIQLSSHCRIAAPMHLRYRLCEVDGELKIERLQAYWEMALLTRGVMRAGPAGWWAGTRMFIGILRHLGGGGAMGFLKGMKNRGLSAKRQLQQQLQLLRQGQPGDSLVFELNGAPSSADELQEILRRQRWDKWIACGDYCTGSLLPREQADARRGIVRGRFDESGQLAGLSFWI